MDELFPVTTVGSWPRSARLRRALRQRQAGEISGEEFDAVADEAVLDALQHQEAAGVDIVTDDEQRRDNFYSFVVGKIDGMRLMPVSELLDYLPDRARFEETLRALDVPAFAIKSPVAVDKLRLRSGLAQDEVAFLQRHTQRPIKVPLPGPYLLTRSAWIEQLSGDAYATQVVYGEESAETFMCAALASRRDPTDELELALNLVNETVRGVDGCRIGV